MIILSNSELDGWIDQRLVGIYIFKEYRSNCRRDGIYGILRSQDSGSSKKCESNGSHGDVSGLGWLLGTNNTIDAKLQ